MDLLRERADKMPTRKYTSRFFSVQESSGKAVTMLKRKSHRAKPVEAVAVPQREHPLEHEEQVRFVSWVKEQADIPQGRLYAVPNGGFRGMKAGKMLHAEGVVEGVPDLCFAYPVRPYHGLYLELKRVKGGYVSLEQEHWLRQLKGDGYAVAVCKGFDEAVRILRAYLAGEPVRLVLPTRKTVKEKLTG